MNRTSDPPLTVLSHLQRYLNLFVKYCQQLEFLEQNRRTDDNFVTDLRTLRIITEAD